MVTSQYPIGIFKCSLGRFKTTYNGVGRCQKVCMCGGGGGGTHVIYVPSVKNQYKRIVFGYMVI